MHEATRPRVHGQGAPHVVAAPPGQTTISPAAHEVMSQFWVPAVSGGQSTTHVPSHVTWQGPAEHVNAQVLFEPQAHVPFAHVPLHEGLSPAHVTWQGGASQAKSHVASGAHSHVPFAQAPLQSLPSPQST